MTEQMNPFQTMPSINLDGIDPDFFSTIIEYIYTSKLDVTKENVDQLLLTAQLLQVQDVIDHCVEFKGNKGERKWTLMNCTSLAF